MYVRTIGAKWEPNGGGFKPKIAYVKAMRGMFHRVSHCLGDPAYTCSCHARWLTVPLRAIPRGRSLPNCTSCIHISLLDGKIH